MKLHFIKEKERRPDLKVAVSNWTKCLKYKEKEVYEKWTPRKEFCVFLRCWTALDNGF